MCIQRPPPIARGIDETVAVPETHFWGHRLLWWFQRPTIHVTNQSGVHALLILTPTQVRRITSVKISKLGSATAQIVGCPKSQQLRLMNGRKRLVRLDSRTVYLTAMLKIGGGWKTLWLNRQFLAGGRLTLLQRHIAEASLDVAAASMQVSQV